VANKTVNRSWLAFRFFNVVSFVYKFSCANVNSVGPPTRLPQAFVCHSHLLPPMLQSFPPGVAEKLKTYVYRLIDPRNGETFYIGKGKGNSVLVHPQLEFVLAGVRQRWRASCRVGRGILAAKV